MDFENMMDDFRRTVAIENILTKRLSDEAERLSQVMFGDPTKDGHDTVLAAIALHVITASFGMVRNEDKGDLMKQYDVHKLQAAMVAVGSALEYYRDIREP